MKGLLDSGQSQVVLCSSQTAVSIFVPYSRPSKDMAGVIMKVVVVVRSYSLAYLP